MLEEPAGVSLVYFPSRGLPGGIEGREAGDCLCTLGLRLLKRLREVCSMRCMRCCFFPVRTTS